MTRKLPYRLNSFGLRKQDIVLRGCPAGWKQDPYLKCDGDELWAISPTGERYCMIVERGKVEVTFFEFIRKAERREYPGKDELLEDD